MEMWVRQKTLVSALKVIVGTKKKVNVCKMIKIR